MHHPVASGNRPPHCRIRTASARRSRAPVIHAKKRRRDALVHCPVLGVRGCHCVADITPPTPEGSRQTLCRRKALLHAVSQKLPGCLTAPILVVVQELRLVETSLADIRFPVATLFLCATRQNRGQRTLRGITLALRLVSRLLIESGVGCTRMIRPIFPTPCGMSPRRIQQSSCLVINHTPTLKVSTLLCLPLTRLWSWWPFTSTSLW